MCLRIYVVRNPSRNSRTLGTQKPKYDELKNLIVMNPSRNLGALAIRNLSKMNS
jgi:hypothetical protein